MRYTCLICLLALPLLVLANNSTYDVNQSDYPVYYNDTPAHPFAIVWTAKAENTLDQVSRTAGAWGTDGKFHLICGNCNTHTSHPNERVYDPVANSWADGLTRPGAGIHNHSAVIIGSKIYIGGGSSGAGFDNNFTVIDLVANTWTTIGAMPVANLLYYEFATGTNGMVYSFGGAPSGSSLINQTWEFNPTGAVWTQRANLPVALRDVAAVGVGDTIYLAGGSNSTGYTPVNTFYKYSVSGNSFTTGPVLPTALLWGAAMVAAHRDSGPQVMVLGGQTASGYLNSAYRYNIRGGYWVTETPMITTRRSHAGDVRNGRLWASCGYNGAIIGLTEEGVPSWIVGVEEQNHPSLKTDNFSITVSPNPFSKRAVISYNLARPTKVNVSVYDLGGKLVATLISDKQSAGTHNLVYDARGLKAGVYFTKLTTDDYTKTAKLIIAR